MSVAVANSTKVDPSVTASIPLVLSGSPTTGNVLIAFINYGQFGTTRTVTPPAGTWTQFLSGTQTFDSIDVWWHLVFGGDGTTWTFTLNDGSEFSSGEMYEISGCSTTSPFDNGAITKSSSTASLNTASLTPTVLSCLALTAMTQDSNSVGSTTVGAGFTIDKTAGGSSGRGGAIASRNSLTSDTTTAISTTWSIVVATEALSALVLVQPPITSTDTQEWMPRQSAQRGPRVTNMMY